MGKTITKVVYKPDTQSTDEYIIIVDPEEVGPAFQLTQSYPAHPLLM
jgi:hypothetical protein